MCRIIGKSIRGKWITGLFLAVLVTALTGCDDAGKVNSIEEDFSSIQEEESVNPSNESGNTTSHIQYMLTGRSGNSTIEVDADIEPAAEKLAVYSVGAYTIDDDYLLQTATAFFDNGNFTCEKPYAICTDTELQEAQFQIDETASLYKGEIYSSPFMEKVYYHDYCLSNYNPANAKEQSDTQYLYFTTENGAEDAEPYATCYFNGLKDGVKWELNASSYGNVQQLTFYPSYQQAPFTQVMSMDRIAGSDQNENISEYETQAIAALSELGYKNFELVNTDVAVNIDDQTQTSGRGFVYTYARSIDGIKSAYLTRMEPIIGFNDYMNCPQNYVSIYVDQYGVEQISVLSHYDIDQESVQFMELTDFESIDAVAQEQMAEALEGINSQKVFVNNVELRYVVDNREQELKMVPAWIYHLEYDSGNENRYTSDICINAIDKTVLNDRVCFDFTYNQY